MHNTDRNEESKPLIVSLLLYLLMIGILFWAKLWLLDTEIIRYGLTIVASIVTFGLAFWALRKDEIALGYIGCTRMHLKQSLYFLLIIWGVVVVLVGTLTYWKSCSIDGLFDISLLSVLKHWLFVGLSEELLFRGYILTKLMGLLSRKGKWWSASGSMLLTSLIFALSHIPQRMVVEGLSFCRVEMCVNLFRVFLVGMVFAWLYVRSRNIIFVGFVHGGLNAPLLRINGDSPWLGIMLLLLSLMLVEIVRYKKIREA